MSNPFTFVNSINSKEYIFDTSSEKSYNPFMVSSAFSYFSDTVLLANEINKFPDLSYKCQYDFLFHSVSKKKRFSKWTKKDESSENIKLIMDHYNFSTQHALDALRILSDDQIQSIKDLYYKGGRNG